MIEEKFNELKNITHEQGCDICEHLEVLRNYASECDHVTELGMRFGVSTMALALGKPKKLVSCDIVKYDELVDRFTNFAIDNGFEFEFVYGNDLAMKFEDTDFLFIDSLHTYIQLKHELSLFGNIARKYLGFHDTVTFGYTDESGNGKGLMPAIEEFLEQNPHWQIHEDRKNNNGLLILKRIN